MSRPTPPLVPRLPDPVRRALKRLGHRGRHLADGLLTAGWRLVFVAGALGVLGLGLALVVDAGTWPEKLVMAVLLGPFCVVTARRVGALALAEGGAVLGRARLGVEDLRFRLERVRGRRALLVEATLETDRLAASDRVQMVLTLHHPFGGPPLKARLRHHAGMRGELLVRELSPPVSELDGALLTMTLAFPLRAIALEDVGPIAQSFVAEVRFLVAGVEEARDQLEVSFVPLGEDFEAPEGPAPPAPTAGVQLVAVTAAHALAATCPVCGDPTDPATPPCVQCEVRHHPECWRFAGRCSTYACEGFPASDP